MDSNINRKNSETTSNSTRYNTMLLSSRSNLEKVDHSMRAPKSYVPDHDPPAQEPQDTVMSTQRDFDLNQRMHCIRWAIEVFEGIPSCSEPHYLRVNERNHIEGSPLLKAMIQGIKDIISIAFKLEFQITRTGIKRPTYHILELCVMDMINKWTMTIFLIKSYGQLPQSDGFIDAIVEKNMDI